MPSQANKYSSHATSAAVEWMQNMLSCKVWTYDYTRQQLSDELDFRVEAVHAKRAQEELDAPAFAFLFAIAQIQMHKRSPTVPSSLKIDPCDSEDACRHLKGKVVVPKVQEFLGRTGTTRNLPHI